METDANVEHIFLSSELEDDEEQERIVDVQFDQYGRLYRRESHFTVFNDHHLSVHTKGLGMKPRSFEFDLGFLDPRPKHVRRISWTFFAIAFALCAGLVFAPFLVKTPDVWLIEPLLLSGFAIALSLAIYHSRDRIVFFSRNGRAPLIVLLNRNPSSASLNEFVSDIIRRVERTHKDWSNPKDFLSAELREHRRLKEEGALSDGAYEVIKQRILGRHR